MRWAQEQRIRFIMIRLESPPHHINRSDLTEEFRISVQQASHDLQLFMKLHPKAMSYNLSTKRYERR